VAAPATAAPAVKKSGWFWKALAIVTMAMVFLSGVVYWRPTWIGSGIQEARILRHGIHSRYVRIGPYRVHYLEVGEGRPLFLVHGLGGSAENWLDMMPELAANGFHIYALDLLGFGYSDKPDVDYSMTFQADLVGQFMDSQGVRQADMAGWSMGGWVSLKFAADHPERVQRLALLDSAGLIFDPVNVPALRPKTPDQLAHMMALLSPHPHLLPKFVARDVVRRMERNDWIIGRTLDSMNTGKDIMNGKLENVKMPVLIVWGKDDRIVPLSVGEELHKEMPQSTLFTVEGCGHLAPTECGDRVVPEMEGFLR